jgi:hypothetical protein
MSEEWTIEGPRVLDIGGDQERVRRLSVAIVGGRVDVVTHSDSPTARVEVASVQGTPLRVRWDGMRLKVTHGVEAGGILDRVKGAFDGLDRNKVVLSISVPEETETSVSTVSASGLLAGMRVGAKANTVSGAITLDDIVGETDVNTVSGDVECQHLRGPLKVNSVSGSVTAQQSEIADVTIHTVSGDVTLDLTNSAATIGSNSVSGDVTVRAPHDGYDVTANIASGQVVVDGRSLRKGSRGQGNRLTEGRGSLRLKANAVSGNVVVLKAVSDTASGSTAATS